MYKQAGAAFIGVKDILCFLFCCNSQLGLCVHRPMCYPKEALCCDPDSFRAISVPSLHYCRLCQAHARIYGYKKLVCFVLWSYHDRQPCLSRHPLMAMAIISQLTIRYLFGRSSLDGTKNGPQWLALHCSRSSSQTTIRTRDCSLLLSLHVLFVSIWTVLHK